MFSPCVGFLQLVPHPKAVHGQVDLRVYTAHSECAWARTRRLCLVPEQRASRLLL